LNFRFLGHGGAREVSVLTPVLLPPGPLRHTDFRRRQKNHLQKSEQMVRRVETIPAGNPLSCCSQQDRREFGNDVQVVCFRYQTPVAVLLRLRIGWYQRSEAFP